MEVYTNVQVEQKIKETVVFFCNEAIKTKNPGMLENIPEILSRVKS